MRSASKSKVYFFFDEVMVNLKKRQELKLFIEGIFRKEGKKLQILNYIFCSDATLLSINRQFLSHDYYTDIITFNISGNKTAISGEIYISVDRVKENAKHYKSSIKEELHRVIFHGALHLCGYKDKTKAEELLMRERENHYLGKYKD